MITNLLFIYYTHVRLNTIIVVRFVPIIWLSRHAVYYSRIWRLSSNKSNSRTFISLFGRNLKYSIWNIQIFSAEWVSLSKRENLLPVILCVLCKAQLFATLIHNKLVRVKLLKVKVQLYTRRLSRRRIYFELLIKAESRRAATTDIKLLIKIKKSCFLNINQFHQFV